MQELSLQEISNVIILIGAVLLALERIYHAFKKPVDTIKTKSEELIHEEVVKQIQKQLPEVFEKCNSAIQEAARQEHQQLFEQIKQCFEEQSTPYFEELERINLEQNSNIELLMGSSRDLLRQHIINVYERNKTRQALSITEREFLNDCFKDYVKEKGNGYVEKIYHRMDDWEVLGEEDFI